MSSASCGARARTAAHCPQNFIPSGVSNPHLAQRMLLPSLISKRRMHEPSQIAFMLAIVLAALPPPDAAISIPAGVLWHLLADQVHVAQCSWGIRECAHRGQPA